MQGNRSQNTRPEIALRQRLHALGLRYRLWARPLPARRHKADIVFRPAKVAVEVRGCFWHGCPDHYRAPASNASYWAEKVERNTARDAASAAALEDAGWALIVVWEHENPDLAASRVADVVAERRPTRR
jgi:DNA mismatch endonuclease (patch repair protein)